MPPKKMKKPKKKVKPTTSNINKQVVIINQPTKRKYTRRKKTQRQPISQFSTPESTIGQVFNLLRFIPQNQPNYQSIQNLPQSPYIPMLDNRQHNYDDDKLSDISASSKDFSDSSTIERFEQEKRMSHKPAMLAPISEYFDEEGGGGDDKVGRTPEFKKSQDEYLQAKRRLSVYTGKNEATIRSYKSQLNTARETFNRVRKNAGLEPV